jgi:hypothetical protein
MEVNMRYLLLLYGDEQAERAMTAKERRAIIDQHMALGRRMREADALVASEALGDSSDAKVLRRDGEQSLVTDGPFAETQEQLGGFYLLECGGIDDALDWAEQVPQSPGLVAEIRPVVPT